MSAATPPPDATAAPPPRRAVRPWGLILGAAVIAAAGAVIAGRMRQETGKLVELTPAAGPTEPATTHPVVIRKPAGPPAVKTGTTDAHGQPVTIACATCHTTEPVNPDARLGTDLKAFHQGLKGAHGNLACAACHNPAEGYGSLRLADGRSLPYPEVMQLCAQCHGPQFRDYQHGAHGGMTGHWDLSKGGRVRNNCVDCHDPHSPKYPTVRPAAGPNDRGGAHPNSSVPEKRAGHE